MQNRFGVKDFFLFLMMIAVLVSVWLAITETDRQWEEIHIVKQKVEDIEGRLESGNLALGTPANAPVFTSNPAENPFSRIESAERMPGYSRGGWLIWALNGKLSKITPLLSEDLYAQIIQGEVLEGLGIRDPESLAWKPLLAKSWQISPDGLKITFQLRDNLRFSDGQPLTADDVVFTFDFIQNPKINCPRDRAYVDRIKSVTKDGPLEVTFTFKEPYFSELSIAAGWPIMPKHFYSKFTPEQFNNSVGYLLGSGPYKLEDPTGWKPGQFVTLVRNDNYWGVKPALKRILFKDLSNDKARLASFINGDVDFLWCTADQYADMLHDQSLIARSKHFNFDDPTSGYSFIGWNEKLNGKPTFFADKRVRRAMTMLTDRQRMIQELEHGYATVATGPFWPKGKEADPGVKPWPFDVEKARQLLAEAGFHFDAANGVLKTPDGQPFRFQLTYPSGSPTVDRLVLMLKDSYARVGIIMEPVALDWGSFTDMLDKRNFEAVTLAWGGTLDEDPYQIFDSSQMERGDDFVSYQDPELDKTIEEARRTIDDAKRNELWHKVHRLLHEDQPYTFLFDRQSLRFIDKRFDNVQVTRSGLNDPTEWFVPQRLQKYHQ